MQLYYSPGACSLAPHIVLRELGLPVELKKVDIPKRQTEGGGDYLKINGKGYVPALRLEDGSILTEVPVILQYIVDQKPESKLAPKAGTMERYHLQEWLNFITSEVHKSFSPLFIKTAAAEWKAAMIARLSDRFTWLSSQLEGKSYLMGEQFTAADAYLFTVLSWSYFVGLAIAPWPVLTRYIERVRNRPKTQEAMKAEGLIE
jgi:glutathione S-transferase